MKQIVDTKQHDQLKARGIKIWYKPPNIGELIEWLCPYFNYNVQNILYNVAEIMTMNNYNLIDALVDLVIKIKEAK